MPTEAYNTMTQDFTTLKKDYSSCATEAAGFKWMM